MKLLVQRSVILVLAVLLLAFALYFTFKPQSCASEECFQNNMEECRPAIYINDAEQAAWKYEVKRKNSDGCDVDVTLLIAKEGELNVASLEGHSMTCTYPVGTFAYPEKNLDVCHGRLKEEIQVLIIERLHGYVINNLDEIKSKLESSI